MTFKRPAYTRPPPSTPKPIKGGVTARADGMSQAIPKSNPVRSEAYRRLVAALPCIYCGIEGYSQAAHLPPDGKGIKQDDRLTFPLCCARPGITGCHADYDQYRINTRHGSVFQGLIWAQQTAEKIKRAGQWPNDVEPLI